MPLLAPEDELPAIIIEPADFFEPTCAVVLPEQGTTGADEHPFGSYNISYPYCRTALRVTVDDIDPSPLLAQITGFARYLSARIVALVCGLETKLASLTVLETFPVIVPELRCVRRRASENQSGLPDRRRHQGCAADANPSAVGRRDRAISSRVDQRAAARVD